MILLTVEQVRKAIGESSHSEFSLNQSGLNVYTLTEELNKTLMYFPPAQIVNDPDLHELAPVWKKDKQ